MQQNPVQDSNNWARMPHAAHKGRPGGRLRGISRTGLLDLGARGLIKIANLRKPGSMKGLRLIFLPSLDAYLEEQAAAAATPPQAVQQKKGPRSKPIKSKGRHKDASRSQSDTSSAQSRVSAPMSKALKRSECSI
jgi:hypothetical protein